MKVFNCKEKLVVVNPYKYAPDKGETIYVSDQGDFIHLDHRGRILFADPVFEFSKPDESDDFRMGFKYLVTSRSVSCLYESDLRILRDLTTSRPIVIGGCGRTGTTLLLSILGSLGNIFAIPEETYAFYPKPLRLQKLISCIEETGGRRWCEKTPKNVQSYQSIHDMFDGNVCIINMIRDGRDVTTSIHPNGKGRYWVDVDRWYNDTLAGIRCNFVLNVKYEDLVQTPDETIKRICDFIGENFDPSVVDYVGKTNVKENIALFGGAKDINTKSVRKWENAKSKYSDRLNEFYSHEKAVELLKFLNYEN